MLNIDKKGTRGSAVESGFVGFRVSVRPVWYARLMWWLRLIPRVVVVVQVSRRGNGGRIGCPVGQLLKHNVDRLMFGDDDYSRWFRLEKFYRLSNGEGRMVC